MSLWEFNATLGGYVKANSPEDTGEITSEQAAALSALLDERPVRH